MPEDNKDNTAIEDNPIYKAILEKLEQQDAKIAALEKQNKEVMDFNKALLAKRGPNGDTVTDVDLAKKKLDAYINEN